MRVKTQVSPYAPSGFTVIIIGAGISGITAAYHLVSRGYTVLLLEAKSRIGGRIHTIYPDNNNALELGCQFIHGPGGNPLTPLLKRFHINFEPVYPEKTLIYNTQGLPIDLETANIEEIVSKKASALAQKRVSEATLYASKRKSHVHVMSEKIKETTVYMPYRAESLIAYKLGLTDEYKGGNYIITNGFNHLLKGLLHETQETGYAEIKLNTVVKEVRDTGKKIIIKTTAHESFEADALICSVPLGVLKANTIKFDPPFPEQKQKAIENLGMAIHEKTILVFDKPFWPDSIHYLNPYDFKADIWREILNIHYFTSGQLPALIFSNHVSDIKMIEKPDQEIINDSIEILKKIFGNNISKLEKSEVTHWYKDPFSQGSYSYHLQKGTLKDNADLFESYGRICFAGEHTNSFPSSVHGAYLSGIEAAEELRSLLYHAHDR